MTPLGMIFERHMGLYRGLTPSVKRPEDALRDVMNVAAGKGDVYEDVKQLMKTQNVNRQVAEIALTHSLRTGGSCTEIPAIKECIEILGTNYRHHHTDVLGVIKSHPGIFNKKILSLTQSEMDMFDRQACIGFMAINRLIAPLGKKLDIDYWSIANSSFITDNCRNNGITAKVVLSGILSHLIPSDYPNHLEGILDISYVSNLFNHKDQDQLELFLEAFVGVSGTDIRKRVFATFLNVLRRSKLIDNVEDWGHSRYHDKIKYLLWVIRYGQWYADTSTVKTEDNLYLTLSHHELVSYAMKNLDLLPEKFGYRDHPKEVLKEVYQSFLTSKVDAMRKSIANAVKYPPLSRSVTSRLPPNWYFIDNEYSQTMEGQHMKHCCGGYNYLSARQAGISLFFHVATDDPHGLTVELKKPTTSRNFYRGGIPGTVEYPIYPEEATLSQIRHSTLIASFVEPNASTWFYMMENDKPVMYQLGQVKGRRNRSPTKEEMLEVKAGLLLISDLSEYIKYLDIPTEIFSVIDQEAIEVRETIYTHQPDLGKRLYHAVKRGDKVVTEPSTNTHLARLKLDKVKQTLDEVRPYKEINNSGGSEAFAVPLGEPLVEQPRDRTAILDDLVHQTLGRARQTAAGSIQAKTIKNRRYSDQFLLNSTLNFEISSQLRESNFYPIDCRSTAGTRYRLATHISNRTQDGWSDISNNPNVFSTVISSRNTQYSKLPEINEEL